MLRRWPAPPFHSMPRSDDSSAAAQLASLPYSSSLPLVLLLAFWLGDGGDDSGRGFVDLAQSGANLVIFTLLPRRASCCLSSSPCSPAIPFPPKRAGRLRYLLAAPVRRERLLRQAPGSGASSVIAFVFLPAGRWSWAGSRTAGVICWPDRKSNRLAGIRGRLLIIVGYLLLAMSVVGAFAFMLGVLTDAPLRAAVGNGAVDDLVRDTRLDHRAGQHSGTVFRVITHMPGATRWRRPLTSLR